MIELIGGALFLFYITMMIWCMYLAVMNLRRNRDKATVVTKVFAYPLLFIGIILDILYNWIVGTIMFLEFPRETVLTSRLSRHSGCGTWRAKVAEWWCKHLLDAFDPDGQHCKAECGIE